MTPWDPSRPLLSTATTFTESRRHGFQLDSHSHPPDSYSCPPALCLPPRVDCPLTALQSSEKQPEGSLQSANQAPPPPPLRGQPLPSAPGWAGQPLGRTLGPSRELRCGSVSQVEAAVLGGCRAS